MSPHALAATPAANRAANTTSLCVTISKIPKKTLPLRGGLRQANPRIITKKYAFRRLPGEIYATLAGASAPPGLEEQTVRAQSGRSGAPLRLAGVGGDRSASLTPSGAVRTSEAAPRTHSRVTRRRIGHRLRSAHCRCTQALRRRPASSLMTRAHPPGADWVMSLGLPAGVTVETRASSSAGQGLCCLLGASRNR